MRSDRVGVCFGGLLKTGPHAFVVLPLVIVLKESVQVCLALRVEFGEFLQDLQFAFFVSELSINIQQVLSGFDVFGVE